MYNQKYFHKGKQKNSDDVEFMQKWIEFLAGVEQNKNFHRYSETSKEYDDIEESSESNK
ncbi:hypothetical protein RO3G_07936 [Rhizopus delemar RA 99-880]|uniref:Uncharacterized protein n=1 Tax=Rhizopus delemar (strain RA 99-880 / ATCC MYA-4621 / FGSC 9543 / NRRL 43880) TaxID=246409 RepID=I1C451_RHIO9|nr:hypothetical protein RO3G_07936 [Rhizopus delemar RA 99-880]|eukprot:EIE83231.1 hypothetical protein RO3G_07936 [Rhizopus delemar RA 99-880]